MSFFRHRVTEVTVFPSRVGFVGLLTLVFVVAKVTGYLHWSWWWVFSPVWISFLACGVLFFAFFGIVGAFSIWENKKRYGKWRR